MFELLLLLSLVGTGMYFNKDNARKLDSINKAGMYLAKNNNFYVSFKGGGAGKPYLFLRTKKAKITETFDDIIREECSQFLT